MVFALSERNLPPPHGPRATPMMPGPMSVDYYSVSGGDLALFGARDLRDTLHSASMSTTNNTADGHGQALHDLEI